MSQALGVFVQNLCGSGVNGFKFAKGDTLKLRTGKLVALP